MFKITLFIPIQPSRLDPTPPFQVLNTLYLNILILLVCHPLMPIFTLLSLLFLSPNLIIRLSKTLNGKMLWLLRLQYWNLTKPGLSLPCLLIKRLLGASGYIRSSKRLMGQWKGIKQGLWLKVSLNGKV